MNNRHPIEEDRALGRLMADMARGPMNDAVRDLADALRTALMALTTDAARRAICRAYGEDSWRSAIQTARAALAKAKAVTPC